MLQKAQLLPVEKQVLLTLILNKPVVIEAVRIAIELWRRGNRRKSPTRMVLDRAIRAECKANLLWLDELGIGGPQAPVTADCWRVAKRLRTTALGKVIEDPARWALYCHCEQQVDRIGLDPVPLHVELSAVHEAIVRLRARAALGAGARLQVRVAVRLANLRNKLQVLVSALEVPASS